MPIDILSYTANKEITYLCTNESNYQTIVNTKYNCLNQNTATCYACWFKNEPEVKALPDNSNVVCVYDSTYFTNGGSCTWTVPTGVIKATFEIWGPGAPGGVSNCCGTGIWGSSGAYMSFTIPVVAGCQYALIAACSNNVCAYCCGCSNYAQACCYGSANCSSVTGYGLCNVYSQGGCTDLVQNMCARLCRIGYSIQGGQGSAPTPCYFANECQYKLYPNACGLCICGCIATCNGSSMLSSSATPVADWNLWPSACITVGLCSYHPVFKIPSIHHGMYTDTNTYGHHMHMPAFPVGGIGSTPTCSNSGCMTEYNFSGTCIADSMSFKTCCCCYPIAGLGGAWTSAFAGSISNYAGRGRTGFVKVTYSCCSSDSRCSN